MSHRRARTIITWTRSISSRSRSTWAAPQQPRSASSPRSRGERRVKRFFASALFFASTSCALINGLDDGTFCLALGENLDPNNAALTGQPHCTRRGSETFYSGLYLTSFLPAETRAIPMLALEKKG